jgi:lipid II:glycine glycyltransferase (peptidoglycan interpeptide bridge formation enzyme)
MDAAWDRFVEGHHRGHVLQTSRWAQLKSAFGWSSERVMLTRADNSIIAGTSLLFRRLPWGQTLAYAPKGPLVNWEDEQEARQLFGAVQEACRRRRSALLKIEPEHEATPALAQTLEGLGFTASAQRIQPLSTIHVDLTPDEESILGCMKPKWRYNIRLAERKGVIVREASLADLEAVQALMVETGARDGFGVHSAAYYRMATELFVPSGLATWLLAEHEGRLLAAIAVFALGKMAWYMWGASSDADRNLMPNHALQWAGMRWARARGCVVYDLWGIPDEIGADPDAYAEPESWGDDGLWGVYRFKQGFGGRVVRYVGAWDAPISQLGYTLYRGALRARAAKDIGR